MNIFECLSYLLVCILAMYLIVLKMCVCVGGDLMVLKYKIGFYNGCFDLLAALVVLVRAESWDIKFVFFFLKKELD